MGWIKDIWDSFKKNPDGLSGRKLSAFWAIVIAATGQSAALTVAVIVSGANFIYLLYNIIAWLIFGALCLSLVTAQNLIELFASLKKSKTEE